MCSRKPSSLSTIRMLGVCVCAHRLVPPRGVPFGQHPYASPPPSRTNPLTLRVSTEVRVEIGPLRGNEIQRQSRETALQWLRLTDASRHIAFDRFQLLGAEEPAKRARCRSSALRNTLEIMAGTGRGLGRRPERLTGRVRACRPADDPCRPPCGTMTHRQTFLPFGRPNFGDEEIAAVTRVLRSGWVGMGPRPVAFEQELAAELGAAHVVTVNSCTSAPFLSLLVAGVGPGDEVIVPSLTWISTANAARYLGATPVFCDINVDTLCVTPASVRARLTPRTKAVIVVHLGGLAVDVKAIRQAIPGTSRSSRTRRMRSARASQTAVRWDRREIRPASASTRTRTCPRAKAARWR